MTAYMVDRNWLGWVWRTGLIALTLLGAAFAWRGQFAARVAADESTGDGATSTGFVRRGGPA